MSCDSARAAGLAGSMQPSHPESPLTSLTPEPSLSPPGHAGCHQTGRGAAACEATRVTTWPDTGSPPNTSGGVRRAPMGQPATLGQRAVGRAAGSMQAAGEKEVFKARLAGVPAHGRGVGNR